MLALLAVRPPRTILTFEDFTAQLNVNSIANPFGAGQYGSRAGSPINAGFQQGDGWTPNVVLGVEPGLANLHRLALRQ